MAIEVDANAKPKYPPLAEDVYQAVVAEVHDWGEIQEKFDESPVHKVQIVYQVNALRDDGKRHEVRSWKERLSLNEKANLRVKHIEKIIGKAKFEAMLAANPLFDVESIVGMNCQIEVIHNATGEYANIGAVLAYRGDNPMAVSEDYVPLAKRTQMAADHAHAGPEHPNVTAAANLGQPQQQPQTAAGPVRMVSADMVQKIFDQSKISYGQEHKVKMAARLKGRKVIDLTADEAGQLLDELLHMPMHRDAIEDPTVFVDPFAEEGEPGYRPAEEVGALIDVPAPNAYATAGG